MSQKEESIDSNQNDEKIKVYDNDDAYLFGDASFNESNEDEEKIDNYKQINNDNNNNLNSPTQSSNKIIEDKELFQENEKNNYEKSQDKDKEILNIYNNNHNQNENYYIDNQLEEDNNYNSPETNSKEDPLINEKFIINDITTDMENEQKYEESNNISIKSKENKNNKNYKTVKNNEMKYSKDLNEQQKEIENHTTNENESNESEVPLITLNFLSICQCCKNQFNSQNNIPYLFKCGHFFCKQCIEEQFTDEEGIKCPNDGLVGKYLSELKILNNFITDKPPTQRTKSSKKYCEYHKGQNLTHYIEDTKELICVYCAFERYKSNPNVEIKEINEKCKSMENIVEGIIDDNQNNVEIIQNSLLDIKKNKENEEKKINEVFNGLFEILKIKRDELLTQIEKIFTDNAKKLSEKLEIFSNKLEKGEKIKSQILLFENNQEEINFSQIMGIYDTFIKEINDKNKITLQKYKFIYNDEIALRGILNNFGSLELKEKNCNFLGNISPINIKEDIIDNINNNNILYKQPFIKVNKEINNINNMQNIQNNNKNNSYKIDTFYHFINNKEKSIMPESSTISNKNQKSNNKHSKDGTTNNNICNLNVKKTNVSNNNNLMTNPNKSSGNIKINNSHNNNINNKRTNKSKNKLTKKYLNNKKGIFLDATSSTNGNSLSKIESHSLAGVNTPKSFIKKFKYNLSLGQNYSFNSIPYLNSLSNNQKINNIKNTSKNRNSKSKNNKSITAPGRMNFKADNKYKK